MFVDFANLGFSRRKVSDQFRGFFRRETSKLAALLSKRKESRCVVDTAVSFNEYVEKILDSLAIVQLQSKLNPSILLSLVS